MTMFAPFDPHTRGTAAEVTVRVADESDLPRCADLACRRNGGEPEVWYSRLAVDQADPERLLVVAEIDGAVVGHACAGWQHFDPQLAHNVKDGWYLTGVIVEPEHRRRGVARNLVQARLDWLSTRADRAWYFASAQNEASLELHREFGFSEVTRTFEVPGVTFTGGVGVLCVRAL